MLQCLICIDCMTFSCKHRKMEIQDISYEASRERYCVGDIFRTKTSYERHCVAKYFVQSVIQIFCPSRS